MSIEINNMQEVQSLLAEMYSRTNNLRPVMRNIGKELKGVIRLSFVDEKSPFGTPWAKSKRAEATNGKTLFKSGALFNSFKFKSTVRSVEVGTNVKYAPIHNFGGVAGRGRSVVMPQRQFMPIDNSNNLPNYLWTDIANLIRERIIVD